MVVKDIDHSCRDGSPDYNHELAEAAGKLSLAPPRHNSGVNTQHLGRWLSAHKDRPGPFVLREGRRLSGKPVRWYVERDLPQSLVEYRPKEADWEILDIGALLHELPDLKDTPPDIIERLISLLRATARPVTHEEERKIRAETMHQ